MLNWFAIIWWSQMQSLLYTQQRLSSASHFLCFGEGILPVQCADPDPGGISAEHTQTLSTPFFRPPLSYFISCWAIHKLLDLILADLFFQNIFYLFILHWSGLWSETCSGLQMLAGNCWLHLVTLTQTKGGVSTKSHSLLCRS